MCGQAGLSISEAYELSPREMHYYLNGSGLNHETLHRSIWETSRLIAFYCYTPYADPKKGKPDMFKFLPLHWDKKAKKKPITLEEFNKINSAWLENQQLHN